MNKFIPFSISLVTAKRFGLVASRAFFYLWLGQLISLLGDHVYRVVLTWLSIQKGGIFGGASLGIAMALPTAILGIFAGVIVDRSDRFKLLIVTDITRAIIVTAIMFLFLSPSPNLVLILGGVIALSIASLLFNPAIQASLSVLAGGDRDNLLAMNGWILGTVSTMGVVGPAIAGLLLSWAPPAWLIGFDAFSFAFSALMLMLMRSEVRERSMTEASPARGKVLSNAKEGLMFIAKHPVLRPQFSTFPIMESVSYAIPFLLPLFIHSYLNADSAIYGLALATWALGRVLGIILVNNTKLKQNRGKIFVGNFILQGLALLAFTLIPIWWVALITFALLGLPSGAAQISMSSYVQIEIPEQLRGRVFAALGSLVNWLIPFGPLVLGALAQWQGVQISFLVISAIFLAGGIYIALHPAVRKVR